MNYAVQLQNTSLMNKQRYNSLYYIDIKIYFMFSICRVSG